MTSVLAGVLLPLVGPPSPAEASSNVITEYPVPPPASLGFITSVPGDSNLWFGDGSNIDSIAADGTVAKYPVCAAPCGPYVGGLTATRAAGGTGQPMLWFVQSSPDAIGSMDISTKAVTLHTVDAVSKIGASGLSQFVTADSYGNPWFGNIGKNTIDCFCVRGQSAAALEAYPTASPPQGFTLGPDGNIWFTETGGNRIGRIDPRVDPHGGGAPTVTEFALPNDSMGNRGPVGITTGADGKLWFAEARAGFGRISVTGTIDEFPGPGDGGNPYGITPGADGNLWFTELSTGSVGRISPTDRSTALFRTGDAQSDTQGITGGPDGNIWFTDIGTHRINRVDVPSADGSAYPGAPTGVTAAPGDGQATVEFMAPPYTGSPGSSIKSYTATSSPGGKTATGSGNSLTVSGLTNGFSYTVTVTATNEVGTGPSSLPSNAVTPRAPTVPGAPTGVSASAGYGQATITFDPPAEDGHSPITTYTATSNPDAKTATGRGAPLTVTGLTNGTSYTFTVTATNAVGTGPSSVPSHAVIPAKPRVTGLSKNIGYTYGVTTVDITGTNFSGVTAVSFGGVPVKAPYFRVNSDTLITAISPPQPEGVVDVTVTVSAASLAITSDGSPDDRFRYSNEGWLSVAPMAVPRRAATATVLDGVACHAPLPPSYCGRVLVAGGESGGVARNDGEVYDPSAKAGKGSWTTVPGHMSSPRSFHVAAPLADGRVLVAGGFSETKKGFTADIYDPAAAGGLGGWTAVIAPVDRTVRGAATATALPDGSVLVAGGYDGATVLKTALIFTPLAAGGTGKWTPGSPMSLPRLGHSAILVNRNTGSVNRTAVLVAGGGTTGGLDLRTAETLDASLPQSPWASAGQFANPVSRPSMALLKSGKVLMPVPPASGSVTARAAVYSPQEAPPNSWSIGAAPMADGRYSGVTASSLPDGRVLVAGGQDSLTTPDSTEIFDPAGVSDAAASSGGDAWRFTVRPMAAGRVSHTASTLRDGSILVAGGAINETALASAEVFMPSLPPPGPMKPVVGKIQGTGSVAGGTVTLEGVNLFPATSVSFAGSTARVLYNTDSRLTVVAPAHAPGPVTITVATPSGVAEAGPFSYLQGGWQAGPDSSVGSRPLNQAVVLNPPGCGEGRLQKAGYPCGKVLVAGGDGQGSAALYDPVGGGWSATGKMSVERGVNGLGTSAIRSRDAFTLTLLPNGTVLAVGGCCKPYDPKYPYFYAVGSYEVYDPLAQDPFSGAVGSWRAPVVMATPRMYHTATVIDGSDCHAPLPPVTCGKVLVAGGISDLDGAVYHSTADIFDPGANSGAGGFTAEFHAAYGRGYHAAALLGNGSVLLTGGLGHDTADPNNVHNEGLLSSAETFDIHAAGGSGGFDPPTTPKWPRIHHTATLLDPPGCHDGTLTAPSYPCGQVLVTGGVGGNPSGLAELYDPAGAGGSGAWRSDLPGMLFPRRDQTSTLLPDGRVLIAGGGGVDDQTAEIYAPQRQQWLQTSSMRAVSGYHSATVLDGADCRLPSPPVQCGRVLVVGSPLDDGGYAGEFSELYTPVPTVRGLAPASGSSDGGAPVMIGGAGFTKATTVSIGGVSATDVVVNSTTSIAARTPRRRATGSVEVVLSNAGGTSTTTPPNPAAQYGYDGCVASAAAGEILFPAGYSLVGLPAGTTVPAQSFLYGWFDLGGGNGYSADNPATTTAAAGHGYWAWFSCTRVLTPGVGTPSSSSPLHAYHASMIGNPSARSPVTVSGHDFAARWDPALNGGAGGYTISGYREPQSLGVRSGIWVFSYVDTTVAIG